MNLVINTDGASRGNPGNAAYAFVLKVKDGELLHQESNYIGSSTNNVAEYMAVVKALQYVIDHYSHKAPHTILLRADSQLVVQQLSGKFKIKNADLKVYYDQVKDLEQKLGDITYLYIPREENFIADRLANQALDRTISQ